MKPFLGYKFYRLLKKNKISDYDGKERKNKRKSYFPVQEIDSSCCEKPGIMVKNIPLESYHKYCCRRI